MTGFLAVVIVFGVIVLAHELGHFVTAKMTGMKVEEFAIGFGPKVASFRRGETLYSIRAIPLGGYNKIAGMEMEDDSAGARSYWRRPIWARLIVISAGSLMNFILPIFLITGSVYYYGILQPSSEPVIGKVLVDSPAATAGLMANDRIISINGAKIDNWNQIGSDFKDKEGQSVKLVIERDGVEKNIQVFPRYDEGSKKAVIGIMGSGVLIKPTLAESFKTGVQTVGFVITSMYHALADMITGNVDTEIAGPVGIAQMTSQYAKQGLQSLINFTVLLSINLGIINLLPIPALDGGHIIMLMIEAVRRKPLPASFLRKIQTVGVVLLLSLMVFATTKDIFRIFG